MASGTVGVAYTQTFAASGGSAPYTFAVSAGTLPAGLALNTATGATTGTATGPWTSIGSSVPDTGLLPGASLSFPAGY